METFLEINWRIGEVKRNKWFINLQVDIELGSFIFFLWITGNVSFEIFLKPALLYIGAWLLLNILSYLLYQRRIRKESVQVQLFFT